MKWTEVQQGGTSADRNRLRQESRQQQAAEPDLKVVHDLAEQVAGLPGVMKIEAFLPSEGEAEAELIVDPEATTNAGTLLGALSLEERVPEPVQKARDRLAYNVARQEVVAECVIGGRALQAAARATERWAAQGERDASARFYERADALLSGKVPGVSREQIAKLRVALGPALQERQVALMERGREADKTRAAKEEAAATLQAARDELHMERTAQDLQEDRPVSAADLAAALDTFRALQGPTQ